MSPFEGESGPVRLSGYLGRPDLARSRTSGLYLFVNSRPVSDRLLVRAVISAYQARLAGGRYPMAVIFLRIDPDLVDVNVHPAKAEVRFRRPGDVFAAASEIMKEALGESFRPFPRQEKPYPASPAPGRSQGVRESTFWESNPSFTNAEPAVFVRRTPCPNGIRNPFRPKTITRPIYPSGRKPDPNRTRIRFPGPWISDPSDSYTGPISWPKDGKGSMSWINTPLTKEFCTNALKPNFPPGRFPPRPC